MEIKNLQTLKRKCKPLVKNKFFDFDLHKRIWAHIAGSNYKYTPELKTILPNVIKYFNGQNSDYDLNKGLYIWGIFGTGKTTIFDITHDYLAQLYAFHPNSYRISSIEKIANHIKIEHNLDLFKYNINKGDKEERKPINLLINEFGTEKNYDLKDFGTSFLSECESMLMARYEVFTDYSKLTHCTSNLGPNDLAKHYPDKLLDRYIEMFNFIELKGESWRK